MDKLGTKYFLLVIVVIILSLSMTINIKTVLAKSSNESHDKTEETATTEKPFFFLFNSKLPAFNVTEFPEDVYSQTSFSVKEDDVVTFYMYNQEASGADRHSFTINAPYNVNLDLAPGQNGNVTLTATSRVFTDFIVNIMNLR